MLPALPPVLELHGKIEFDEGLRAKLKAISPATIARLLCEVRQVARRHSARRAGFSSAVRRSVIR